MIATKTERIRFIAPAVIGGALLLLAATIGGCPQTTADPNDPNQVLKTKATDHVESVGSPTLTVIEYGDFQCSHCGDFFRQTYATIKSNYVDAGKIRWVFRQFPLRQFHPQAEIAAEASECAAQQSDFFAYHDLLFSNQNALLRENLISYAEQAGLDVDAFTTCLESGSEAARVQADVDEGTILKVTGTPTFFIGKQKVVGFQDIASMSALLDAALADQ